MSIAFTDNSAEVLARLKQNEVKALTAIGQTAVEITTDYIMKKYGRPIYRTGDLLRSVAFKPEPEKSRVLVGCTVEYAPWVAMGTRTMKARPFLQDALRQNVKIYESLAAEQMGDSFSGLRISGI